MECDAMHGDGRDGSSVSGILRAPFRKIDGERKPRRRKTPAPLHPSAAPPLSFMEATENGLGSVNCRASVASNDVFSPASSAPRCVSFCSEAAPLASPPYAAPANGVGALKRKRGRPKKFSSGGSSSGSEAPAAADHSRPASFAVPTSLPLKKKSSSSEKSARGHAGNTFTTHFMTVAEGKDVAKKIMSFIQQRKCAVCILSATGSISTASLHQPATSGGNVTYEGHYEILSLSGSYLHTEIEGVSSITGGLSVCLSGDDGHMVGGVVEGALRASGAVQVIAGSFVVDMGVDSSTVARTEACGKLVGSVMMPNTHGTHSGDEHCNMKESSFIQ